MIEAGQPPGTSVPDHVCAVCGTGGGEIIITAADYPAYLLPLPPAVAPTTLSGPLTVLACRSCGHMQQGRLDPELQRCLYEEYYSHYSVDASEALVPPYRVPFDAFLDRLAAAEALPAGRVLEIGCSAGERAGLFRRLFGDYVGIDASSRVALARQNNPDLTFLQGYFPATLPDGRFSGVVTQFNLEHIPDLGAFLDAAHDVTDDGAVLLIQVPDAEDWTRKAQPNFIAHEHIHFFRRPQLDLALRRHGWQPFAWGESGPSLICAARRAAPQPAARVDEADPLAAPRRQAALYAARPALPDGPAIYYGVGPLLFWLLMGVPTERVAAVVDDNPTYHGLALPVSGHVVGTLSAETLRRVGTVVLSLNPMYHPVVLDKIRALGVSAKVLALAEGHWSIIDV